MSKTFKSKETLMEKVENGIFVSVDYKGTLQNGEVFDTSSGRQPLEVQIGAGKVIKGFEEALLGMSLNEKKSFTIEPEAAYGQRDEKLKRVFARAEVPPEIDLQVGQIVGIRSEEGQQIPASIIQVDDENVTADMNHPLAGEVLHFEIEVVGISSTPTQVPDECGQGCDCSSCGC
jgi:peptidylprolyl isomerase